MIQDIARIPANPAIEGIPDAIAAAARAHGAEGGVVVMVVQPGERNAYDQQVRAMITGMCEMVCAADMGALSLGGCCAD